MKSLWMDEGGAILSVELILIMVMVVIGLVVGLASLRDVIDAKLVELSAAVAAIDPGYGFGGIIYTADDTTASTADGAWVAGSAYSSAMVVDGDFGPATVLESEDTTIGTPAIVSE
jgi:hypothetical protein